MAAWFLGGVTAGGLLLAAGAGLRYLSIMLRAVGRLQDIDLDDGTISAGAPSVANASSPSAANGSSVAGMGQVLAALYELRDAVLLPDDARENARARILSLQRERLYHWINEALEARSVLAARHRLADAMARFGADAELNDLKKRIDRLATETEPLAYANAVRRIEKCIDEGDWLTAEHVSRSLATERPDSARCRQLLEATRRGRRYALIQQYTTNHQWSEAAAAAGEFLQSYPDSLEAQSLRIEVQTLAANAEIERRKQLEVQIKEHVRHRRFGDALRLARLVLHKYPDSPQAQALARQVPALEKMLAGEGGTVVT
jgi:hypothetical protein